MANLLFCCMHEACFVMTLLHSRTRVRVLTFILIHVETVKLENTFIHVLYLKSLKYCRTTLIDISFNRNTLWNILNKN